MRRLLLAFTLCSSFASCGSESTPADAPMLDGEKFSLTWGPVSVAAGVESTQCVWMRLGNDAEIKVHQLHNMLNDASAMLLARG
jgi:hypothetical protein